MKTELRLDTQKEAERKARAAMAEEVNCLKRRINGLSLDLTDLASDAVLVISEVVNHD